MNPEDYWISRGENVIGREILEEGERARQAPTYQAIAGEIVARGFGSVLDIGCNVTALAMFLELAGYSGKYIGVDSNPNAIKVGRELGRFIHYGILQSVPVVSSCVVVKDVIEHLENLEPLRGAFRVSKKCVIVSFFIVPGEHEIIQKTERGYYHNQYRESDLLALAGECGFALEKKIDAPETTGTPNRAYVFVKL